MYELPLVLFTIIGQWAVGLVAALVVLEAVVPDVAKSPEVRRSGIAVFPLICLALVAAFFHLGYPLGAYNVLSNLATSWLSREILATNIFAALSLAYSCAWYKGLAYRRPCGLLTLIAGIVLIFASAKVYMLPAHPLWNNWHTPLAFYASAFALGTASLAFCCVRYFEDATPRVWAYLGAAVVVAGLLVFYAAVAGQVTVSGLFLVRVIGSAGLLTALAAGLFLGRRPGLWLVSAALAGVLIGELAGRALFYVSVLGQPGF